ncbi:MAG: FAD-dependent monooxygenase [Burkholderiales bacterium]|nr:FAD-dependent monooxygenase [Burkholderiales bacterium]
MHDIVIVGAGPVGGCLALAIADADLDVVALDARPANETLRADRSLAISHGTRLVFDRLGLFARVAAVPQAVTPITTIDISQAGGFGVTTLTAEEHGIPALGYVVSYRALTQALDDELGRTRTSLRYGSPVAAVTATADGATIELAEGREPLAARLAVVADGAGTVVAGVQRDKRDYGQVALIAKVDTEAPHAGVAYERFTPTGPVALLPEADHYGLVWTMAPAQAERVLALSDGAFLAELARHFGTRRTGFTAVRERRTFPLALEVARPTTGQRCVLIGNAAQSLHPIAGQGFNLGVRDAFELAQAINTCAREALGERAMLDRYAARRRGDRYAGIAFTHGLTQAFAYDSALVSWPRGIALALLDAMPPAKRAFTRAMMFGI